ncbi:hypothetical protein VTJ49DRAFT_5663 [Mycothermus thermophilus]|uniref:Chromatin modification-related protein n=1 Tax=Humicola insolens TaxID=85995 RepID=A0ABR3VKR0_HUMIN
MPRDDLTIDFVRKMPPVETLDPALILDEWINRTQNLPEELRFMQDEIADKDRQYDKLIREIEDRDMRIQKWIKAHGSHHPNPKEEEYRATIRKNFAQAEQLSSEKLALTQKLQQIVDKHIRQLDMQLKMLYDRAEPGFTDPDELPSLLRPSPANAATNGILRNGASPAPGASATTALNTVTANGVPARVANAQIRSAQAQQQQQHASASAPASPAASMIMSRQARESSAGPATKRLPRSNSGLSNLPATSSGLARHASLGPGTPKGGQTASGLQRAGSAGPRATSKGSLADRVRKGTPSGTAGRKKGTPAAGGAGSTSGAVSKSGLSRVKRAAAKNSPSSTADSELSDASSVSDSGSDAVGMRTGGRGTPAFSRAGSNVAGAGGSGSFHHRSPSGSSALADGSGGGQDGPGPSAPGGRGETGPGGHHLRNGPTGGDVMEIDEDEEAGDDRKYCSCRNVSWGNMVACDNDECPYEWFHWGCVGLKSEPNGTWYCPECSEKLKKKGGREG